MMKALRFSMPMFSSKVEDEMELQKEKTARLFSEEKQNAGKPNYRGAKSSAVLYGRTSGDSTGGSSKVFAEDLETWEKGILDPGSELMLKWNYIFLTACIIALFVDPLYFYLASVKSSNDNNTMCIKLDENLKIVLTLLRTLADVFYIVHIFIKFRTAYVAPSARVFGRGELVMNRKKIATKYLRSDFCVDLFAALPLPQIVIWLIIPAVKGSNAGYINNALALIVFLQYLPRLYLIFPLSSQIIQAAGVVMKTAWAGAAYNLCLFMLASHVLGASWYLLSIYRQTMCWKSICKTARCDYRNFDCDHIADRGQLSWANETGVFQKCDATDDSIDFNYGIFKDALTKVVSQTFCRKYFYCLWWGLQNLSSYAQNLSTSAFIGETLFAILIAILGLVLFALLIGNMQTYLQSITLRLEEWRLKRKDTEEWMRHRQLPEELRARVRKYIQYKWLATRGVDEDAILQALPTDLRRDIQRHLCLDLVRRVPFFAQMDEPLLDAICERLVSCLSTEGTYIVREGDPVTEMLFIIRGKLESSTTNGGRTGFFDSTTLKPGDFCGEELLQWALVPRSTVSLPSSTRTVKALVEVEAFALRAEDLKFVANQFRRLHSKKLQHTVRFYSHHWRTWAACFIQSAWRRFKRRKIAKDFSTQVSFASRSDEQDGTECDDNGSDDHLQTSASLGPTFLASKFAATARKGAQRSKFIEMAKLKKPEEPDYYDSFE